MTLISVISVALVVCLVGPVAAQHYDRDIVRYLHECQSGFTVQNVQKRSKHPVPIILGFQNKTSNIGGWDQTTSHFTAPCNGAYYFDFHGVSSKDSDFIVALKKGNDDTVAEYGSIPSYQYDSNSALLVLNEGEKVHLELTKGDIPDQDSNKFFSFSGFLVHVLPPFSR